MNAAVMASPDLWAKLRATLPAGSIQWRQDGKPSLRDGKWFARFVCFIDANTVRERLDSVCCGEWDLTLELLPPTGDAHGEAMCGFKARLQILGVIREDVGLGKDYKSAATDAFKRAATRFGIGAELYDYDLNWVQVDGDSRFAKPLEDPQVAYLRQKGNPAARSSYAVADRKTEDPGLAAAKAALDLVKHQGDDGYGFDYSPDTAGINGSHAPEPDYGTEPKEYDKQCPKCGSEMWDNRIGKRNPKAPDWKCKDRSCDGVIWPPKA